MARPSASDGDDGAGLSDSRLANLGARVILDGHEKNFASFGEITRRALARFRARQWRALHADAVERLDLYGRSVDGVVSALGDLLGPRLSDRVLWMGMKAVYSGAIAERGEWELAETFFNSVSRRVFDTVGVDPQIEFIDTDVPTPPTAGPPPWRDLPGGGSLPGLIKDLLARQPLDLPWVHLRSDAAEVGRRIAGHLRAQGIEPSTVALHVLTNPFFRGHRAYLVGRLVGGGRRVPLVLAIRHQAQGLAVDAVLLDEDAVSILFSFTRSYFHVEAERPYELVRFLRTLMPRKRVAELYMSIGHTKHGKTELYRDILRHLRTTTHRFDFAPGVPGMVMLAFSTEGLDLIFKLIRDRFPSAKGTDREQIRAKYHLVKTRDRAGRLVDAHEFEHLTFDVDRFTPELLDELLREAAHTVRLDGDRVVFDHVYVERRVTPLNVYLREASPEQVRAAVVDYGQAIKDLAATDFFPGDLLLKNFGVTRHGRVVFYDYDELVPLTSCTFRPLPAPRTDEEVYAAEPWFTVGPDDVFPEELPTFMGLQGYARQVLQQVHGDLFTPETWWRIQERLRAGETLHILPYRPEHRLGTDEHR